MPEWVVQELAVRSLYSSGEWCHSEPPFEDKHGIWHIGPNYRYPCITGYVPEFDSIADNCFFCGKHFNL